MQKINPQKNKWLHAHFNTKKNRPCFQDIFIVHSYLNCHGDDNVKGWDVVDSCYREFQQIHIEVYSIL